MMCAADFRAAAREILRGKWLFAVIAGLIATVLGGVGARGPEFTVKLEGSGVRGELQIAGQTLFSTGGSLDSGIAAVLLGGAVYFAVVGVVLAVLWFALGSVVEVGYARYNLELADRGDPSIDTLFSYFGWWKTMVAARFLQTLYILLWMLLLIVPGVVAAHSYAMTGYILAENPDLSAKEAIGRSKEIMYGNRWRLFCLQLSFIGWDILCALTAGIGNLWLTPYKQAAVAAFYREITRGPEGNFEFAESFG